MTDSRWWRYALSESPLLVFHIFPSPTNIFNLDDAKWFILFWNKQLCAPLSERGYAPYLKTLFSGLGKIENKELDQKQAYGWMRSYFIFHLRTVPLLMNGQVCLVEKWPSSSSSTGLVCYCWWWWWWWSLFYETSMLSG